MPTYYLWSEYHNGGETEERKSPDGRMMTVVLEKNVTTFGSKVTQKELDMSDEDWEAKLEQGVIREYPPPEGASEYVSPAAAMLKEFLNPDTEDVDVERLYAVGALNAQSAHASEGPGTPPEEEKAPEKPVAQPKGA